MNAFDRLMRDLDVSQSDKGHIIQSRNMLHSQIAELEVELKNEERLTSSLEGDVKDMPIKFE